MASAGTNHESVARKSNSICHPERRSVQALRLLKTFRERNV